MQKVTLQPWGRVELLLFVCAFVFGRGVILIEICCCCANKCNVDTHANNSVLFLTVFYPLFVLCAHMYCALTVQCSCLVIIQGPDLFTQAGKSRGHTLKQTHPQNAYKL